jgi:hypothetical protein
MATYHSGTGWSVGLAISDRGSHGFLCKYCRLQRHLVLEHARLLRPLFQRMEDTGSAVSGDKIARLFKNQNLRYGVRTDSVGGRHLEILMELPEKAPGRSERRYMKSGSFPEGYYEWFYDELMGLTREVAIK